MLTAILSGLASIAYYIVVYTIVLLTFDVITSWFEKWHTENEVDKDDVGFAIRESIKSNDVRVVQGVFNKKTGKVKNAIRIQAEQIDKDAKMRLGKEKLTIYS